MASGGEDLSYVLTATGVGGGAAGAGGFTPDAVATSFGGVGGLGSRMLSVAADGRAVQAMQAQGSGGGGGAVATSSVGRRGSARGSGGRRRGDGKRGGGDEGDGDENDGSNNIGGIGGAGGGGGDDGNDDDRDDDDDNIEDDEDDDDDVDDDDDDDDDDDGDDVDDGGGREADRDQGLQRRAVGGNGRGSRGGVSNPEAGGGAGLLDVNGDIAGASNSAAGGGGSTSADGSGAAASSGGRKRTAPPASAAEDKKARERKRILRNRELARVSNERRKGRIKAMEQELEDTRVTVKNLEESIQTLEAENQELKKLLENRS
jgi:hypothetical protein